MYSETDKKFHCNNCNKVIETGEKCWMKWSLPPSHFHTQIMPSLALRYENAPMVCSECAKQDLRFSEF